jgi:membrane dipeptidase
MSAWSISPEAAALHRDALVWDNHSCPSISDTDASLEGMARMRAAGVDVLGVNLGDSDIPLETLGRMAGRIQDFARRHPNDYRMVRSVAEIEAVRRDGLTGILLNVEGCYALDGEIGLVEVLFDIGVRWMAMVYNKENSVGYGVHDAEDLGLKPFGRLAIAEMDRLGMIKCCSHTGYRTAMDVLTSTDRPTIFSHSNPKALREHPRNISDELIRACAATGGTVGINGIGIFLGDNDTRSATVVDHIVYVADLIGPRHVAIGFDYVYDQEGMRSAMNDGGSMWPAAYGYNAGIRFVEPEQWPDVTEGLLKRGWAESDIRGVLGENLLRVAREIWPA